jgi:hypothetical protein
MPCHVAVSVRTTFLHRNLTCRRSPEAADFELSAEWSGIAIPQVEIESGLQVSASTPQTSSANCSGTCHTAHSSATCNPSHEVIPVLPRVLEEFGESDLFGEVKQHAGVR